MTPLAGGIPIRPHSNVCHPKQELSFLEGFMATRTSGMAKRTYQEAEQKQIVMEGWRLSQIEFLLLSKLRRYTVIEIIKYCYHRCRYESSKNVEKGHIDHLLRM